MTDTVSPQLARRIALAAQGFGRPLPAVAGTRQVAGVVDRLGLLQIDSVNVFERSHYLPAFSRVGGYDRTVLDRLSGARGRLVEYWAHQAAFIPRDLWPLFAFRREEYRRKGSDWGGWVAENRDLAAWLISELAAKGPMRASEIEHDANERRGPWWGWSDVKRTLEWMFRTGEVVCVERRRFERVYALPEQALTTTELATEVPEPEAVRELVARAAQALGIATAADLADYWRMKAVQVRPAIEALVDDGVLLPATVPGWQTGGRPTPVWLHRDARRPRRIETTALLSPFDPVVWFRPRTERLFDFHYRIEIYTPEPDRVFGYYSLPVLVDDAIVGRVDLKSDRKARVLRVQSAWAEPGAAPGAVAERLVPVLRRAANWQGLDEVAVAGRGSLSPALEAALELDGDPAIASGGA
ncbi:winged helix-turn-helix domain-containing protein [Agromyces aerolatus]|uniref:winged helix-turn-helix domain-containing protein n=1 Tax=Agromyces sp. LY-1074 TaxID=3074080 RepID=UPI00286419D7|nr:MULTISPECIES: crosslink repair DNA glycosylase YcaQ family protein [unclassified Agromyces]MDR5698845.1 crosslink repair DNA glycosylase YcaQ family protein [Agromyces sp. LY-1074]MDR5705377.1 crosslink repair DNA glycosylase YcaQ family protein [Agromyces sp. LY-1358]